MQDLQPLKALLDEMGCAYLEEEPMCDHTTFKIGGPADLFVKPASLQAACRVVEACREMEIPLLPVGGGSNLLVSDMGIRGVVLHTGGLGEIDFDGGCLLSCSAGVKLSRICSYALEKSLSGLEFAWGIPGTCGGALMMNAGAYGGEMSHIVVEATHIDEQGNLVTLTAEEMSLGYRSSVYSANGGVIVSMKLRMTPRETELIRMQMEELMQRRRDKQPLDMPSAGSVFKRPTGQFAGTLIEQCGLKGCRVGGAMVSEKHAGFIVNCGGATSSDVRRLIEKIKEDVFLQTGVALECEVRFVK